MLELNSGILILKCRKLTTVVKNMFDKKAVQKRFNSHHAQLYTNRLKEDLNGETT